MNKKQIRNAFRKAVFNRDGHKCRICGTCGSQNDKNLDAHHITNRKEIENGGYVLENGITLCKGKKGSGSCHEKAEEAYVVPFNHDDLVGFYEEDLYVIIESSKELAIEESKKL